ncbi:hypothetical protein [Microtetraspora malaysiensis]|uniref:hypothetical protein n=1 Tax=Microtetraspora malaysiensis TaxID=161358 RepID=UPI003D92B69C
MPPVALSWDADAGMLVVTDTSSGRSVRAAPASLCNYGYDRKVLDDKGKEQGQRVYGLAALNADGLVLLDIPGGWSAGGVAAFASASGVPYVNALAEPARRVRTVLAGRAPGYSRFVSGPVSRLTARQRQIITYGVGAAGLVVMIVLVSTVGGAGWRGLSWLGRFLLDLLEVKWLAIFFAPLLVVIRPVQGVLHRSRTRRGEILGPPGGPNLQVRKDRFLRVRPARPLPPEDIPIGADVGKAMALLVYRYADLSGLFIMTAGDLPLRHIPGPWSPNEAHEFAAKQGLAFSLRTLTREEYLDLVTRTSDALP